MESYSTEIIGDDSIIHRKNANIKKLVTDTRATYTDVIRTPSRKEIVVEKINIVLASPEGQVLGKPSGRRFANLIKI